MKRKKYFGQMMACMLSVLFLLSVFYGGKSPVRVNAKSMFIPRTASTKP